MKTERITVTINGEPYGPHEVPLGLPMIDFLHEYAGLTGTKISCGIGECRACVVIVDAADGMRKTMRTCITASSFFDGASIRTVEGHVRDGSPSPLQQAFLDHYAFQCGFCTSGFLNEAQALIEDLRTAPVLRADVERVIAERLTTHVCRCTGYVRYLEAIRAVVLADPALTR